MTPLSFPGYSQGRADWCCQSHSAAETDESAWALQDGKGGGEGFEVQKYGDGRVALIGEHMLQGLLPIPYIMLGM